MGATQIAMDDVRALRATLRLLTVVVGFGLLAWLACLVAALAWAAPHAWQLAANVSTHAQLPNLAPLLARGPLR